MINVIKLVGACLIASLITVMSFNPSNAQNISKREVVLLKESPKIDSLILRLISIPGEEKAVKDDSCFLLAIYKGNARSFVQGLPAFNKRTEILSPGKFQKDKTLGYFEIYGHLVFVYGDDFMNKFFERTKSKKTFVFRQSKSSEIIDVVRNYMSWAIFYRDEVFNYGMH